MKTIIAGSRRGIPMVRVREAVASCPWTISVVISGEATGVDKLGAIIAEERGWPVERFPANWHLLGKAAGPERNRQMLTAAEALVAVWDGKSRGTAHMISIARSKGIPVHVVLHGVKP